ncbi:MAG: AraC family transcriptional regulator [Gracilimonas sp.]|nr:AraC family transcriptional regulator [Gracilimonas sp.]
MRIIEKRPDKALSELINRYLFIKVDKAEMPEVKILPTGYSYLTRVYGDPSFAKVENDVKPLPTIFLGGQITKHKIKLYPRETFCHFGIEFKPVGIFKLFHIPMSNTVNTFTDFAQLVSPNAYDSFYDLFSEDQGFDMQCSKLDDFFLSKLSTLQTCPKVDQVVHLLQDEMNGITLKEVANQVFLSTRQLRRKFKKCCGISPQAYQNILQLNQIYEYINQEKHAKLQDLAYQCGYYDVSHFINSFKKMMNDNPSVFLESDDSFINTYIKHSKR